MMTIVSINSKLAGVRTRGKRQGRPRQEAFPLIQNWREFELSEFSGRPVGHKVSFPLIQNWREFELFDLVSPFNALDCMFPLIQNWREFEPKLMEEVT